MKKTKLFLMLVMLLMAVTGAVAQSWTSGDCTVTLSDGVLTVSGSGNMEDHAVNEQPWKDYYNSITSIVVEDGVTSIGSNAFRSCNAVTSISLPNSLVSIGNFAFYGCPNLTTISVATDNPSYSSADGVLFDKEKTTLIQYPNGKVGGSYIIPASVTSIGDYAFDHCIGLTTVTIGYNVTSIGEYAFNSCTSLATVDIPNSVKSIKACTFENCTSLATVTFGNNVESINNYAFSGCTSLTSVDIPAKVTNITVKAFAGCTDLATVTLNSNPFIAADALPTGAAVTMNLTANPASGAYWMTFYNHNFTFEADANTQVLKAALNGQDLEVTELTTDQTVTKQNAVILKSTSANITMTLVKVASSNDFSGNSLKGATSATGTTSNGQYFVLNNGTNGMGFYRVPDGTTVGIGGEAYLQYSGDGDFIELLTYTVDLTVNGDDAQGTEKAKWQGKVGSGEYQSLPFDGVKKNQTVTMKYSGKKKVKNITIEAAAAEPAGKVVDLATLNANYIALNGDTLSGTLGANVKISIADGATVMLDGVSINANGTWTSGNYAGITCLGDATIILKDGTTNAIRGFNKEYPGIFAAVNHQLTIKGEAAGTGSLNTSSNGSAAGIGGGYRPGLSCGSIEIQGGVITATGGQLAAGIGSGWYSNCGNIYISGGTVTATGGQKGAGIGSGNDEANCGNIYISGGTVTATAGEWSAGIGSGAFKSSCGTITITSGVTSVTVKKNDDNGQHIGAGGYNSTCGTVTIEAGANVTQQ